MCISIVFIAVIKYPEKNNLRAYSGLQFQKEYSPSLGLGRGTVTEACIVYTLNKEFRNRGHTGSRTRL